jgi:hypothetical protein
MLLTVGLVACGDDQAADEIDESQVRQTYNDYYNGLYRGDFEAACDALASPEGLRRTLGDGASPAIQRRVELASDAELGRSCPTIMRISFEEVDAIFDPEAPEMDFLEGVAVQAQAQGDVIVARFEDDGATVTVRMTGDYEILEFQLPPGFDETN